MLLRFSFAFISISLIASTATVADAAKTVRGTRRGLKSTKAPKSPKSGKIGKSGKSGKSSSSPSSSPSESPSGSPSGSPSFGGYYQTRMLESEMGERKLSLQYMTDRFNEEGSVRSFVDSLGYEANLQSGRGEKENVLSKKDCEGLMSLINIDSDEDKYPFEDYQKYIDENDLVSIIGKDKFNALLDFHREVVGATIPLESIKVRHMKGNNVAFLEYHTDESGHKHGTKLSSLIVALNDNSSVKEGGELYYLQEDGPVLAAREQGKAFAHSYNVIHGVAPHVGDRVSLILHFNHDLAEDVAGRNLTEETARELS